MECSLPKRDPGEGEAPAPGVAPAAPAAEDAPAGYGMANYGRIFRSRADGGDARPAAELAEYVAKLEKLGIVRSVPFGVSNDEVAALLRDFPDRFIGLARISGFLGKRGVREQKAEAGKAQHDAPKRTLCASNSRSHWSFARLGLVTRSPQNTALSNCFNRSSSDTMVRRSGTTSSRVSCVCPPRRS